MRFISKIRAQQAVTNDDKQEFGVKMGSQHKFQGEEKLYDANTPFLVVNTW